MLRASRAWGVRSAFMIADCWPSMKGERVSAKARQRTEAQALLHKVNDKAMLVALDERGKSMGSQAFATKIAELRDDGAGQLVFVLGGPDGHGGELLQRASLKLSLSPMTLPHGLARAVCCEQIYRALTILANHPYHRE